jgi:hypothetical protein
MWILEWSVIILLTHPPGLELETSGFDTILSCMYQPVQPKAEADEER